ncbi:multidrug effflux MFS transporter [Actinomyces sp. B33]|uniref:multidrug effflux MFS transporter n=1 Tax=Actinomyces sp. B33 TaxID=2942131 RepID=UPI002340A6E1|nr:multidrug effflux MFS transporter [Actinomyces sp. B33]MDC4233488.1 multidrug effflux MFS transporter [Actinomyces sp. B33]
MSRPDSTPDPNDQFPTPRPAGIAVTAALLITLALQNAVPPLSTDMYAPAFPQMTSELATTSAVVGLTLTTFFLGFGSGQIVGGAVSDQIGRRRPMIAGGILALAGSIACALSPTIGLILVGRFFQGFGGGVAAAVGRAILVDVAHGNVLARTMSLLQAIGGFAPMLAPIAGGLIVTHWPWRAVFWCLAAFTLVMSAAAWRWAPESLPPERRHSGGLPRFFHGLGRVMRIRGFVAFMATNVFVGFTMFGYIANATYVFQQQLGLSPLAFSWVFAANALLSTLMALVNIRLIGRFEPRSLIVFGLSLAAGGVAVLAVATFALDQSLLATELGFAMIMTATSFIFGNSGALSLGHAREHAGTASAVQGLVQSLANGLASPLATSGGAVTAVPMVCVMIVGIVGAWLSFAILARMGRLPGPEGPGAPGEIGA